RVFLSRQSAAADESSGAGSSPAAESGRIESARFRFVLRIGTGFEGHGTHRRSGTGDDARPRIACRRIGKRCEGAAEAMTRREWLALLSAAPLLGQGMSRRSVKALPRGKPSGLPFPSRFTDIAAAAGLRAPVIYGGIDRKNYLLETVGCGVAFFDFDND